MLVYMLKNISDYDEEMENDSRVTSNNLMLWRSLINEYNQKTDSNYMKILYCGGYIIQSFQSIFRSFGTVRISSSKLLNQFKEETFLKINIYIKFIFYHSYSNQILHKNSRSFLTSHIFSNMKLLLKNSYHIFHVHLIIAIEFDVASVIFVNITLHQNF